PGETGCRSLRTNVPDESEECGSIYRNPHDTKGCQPVYDGRLERLHATECYQPAAKRLQLVYFRTGKMENVRWEGSGGAAVQTGEFRSEKEIPRHLLLLRERC